MDFPGNGGSSMSPNVFSLCYNFAAATVSDTFFFY